MAGKERKMASGWLEWQQWRRRDAYMRIVDLEPLLPTVYAMM